MPNLLEIENLRAGYGDLTVLHGVTLSVGEGEVVGLLGANGAGKTTLVRTLSGQIRAAGGHIRCGSAELTGMPPHWLPRAGVGLVLEGRNLFGELTVKQNLALALHQGQRRREVEHRFSMKDVLELFPVLGEKHAVPAGLLSGGQQQMVAIGRALLLQPRLLVLDEPSTGLAPKIIKDIVQVLQALRQRGMSMLLVEQNVGMAAQLTDRAYVLSVGRVVHKIDAGGWERALGGNELVKAYLGAA